jgi:hypothetical protein
MWVCTHLSHKFPMGNPPGGVQPPNLWEDLTLASNPKQNKPKFENRLSAQGSNVWIEGFKHSASTSNVQAMHDQTFGNGEESHLLT